MAPREAHRSGTPLASLTIGPRVPSLCPIYPSPRQHPCPLQPRHPQQSLRPGLERSFAGTRRRGYTSSAPMHRIYTSHGSSSMPFGFTVDS
eukprot:3307575-Amphidinium_carterae.1